MNGLCPPEPDERKAQKADDIEVFERVERQTSVKLRGRIPATVCNEGVRELVERQDDGHSEKTCKQRGAVPDDVFYHTMTHYTAHGKKKQEKIGYFEKNPMLSSRYCGRYGFNREGIVSKRTRSSGVWGRMMYSALPSFTRTAGGIRFLL